MQENVLILTEFAPESIEHCLALFDANCPKYFAPNERADYVAFLHSHPVGYKVVKHQDNIIGAFGLTLLPDNDRARISWIMIDPTVQRSGAGSFIMQHIVEQATTMKLTCLDIAASQFSEPFFARFGASRVMFTQDGWGAGMHKVDMELPLGVPDNKR